MCSCKTCAVVLCACLKSSHRGYSFSILFLTLVLSSRVFEIHHFISSCSAQLLRFTQPPSGVDSQAAFVSPHVRLQGASLCMLPCGLLGDFFRKWSRGWDLGSNEIEREAALGVAVFTRIEYGYIENSHWPIKKADCLLGLS